MWSTAKPPTVLAILLNDRKPSRDLQGWMEGAIERSENCPEREMVLYLQHVAGSPAKAVSDFNSVLRMARATGTIDPTLHPPEAGSCTRATRATSHLVVPLTEYALQLGVTQWHIDDAIAFAHALATGVYGRSGERVLSVMRVPKSASDELTDPKLEYTAPPNWGAGNVFDGYPYVAYKAGWGGSQRNPQQFVVEQYGVVERAGHKIAFAAAFKPRDQPSEDDPGQNGTFVAIEKMLQPLRTAIDQTYR